MESSQSSAVPSTHRQLLSSSFSLIAHQEGHVAVGSPKDPTKLHLSQGFLADDRTLTVDLSDELSCFNQRALSCPILAASGEFAVCCKVTEVHHTR